MAVHARVEPSCHTAHECESQEPTCQCRRGRRRHVRRNVGRGVVYRRVHARERRGERLWLKEPLQGRREEARARNLRAGFHRGNVLKVCGHVRGLGHALSSAPGPAGVAQGARVRDEALVLVRHERQVLLHFLPDQVADDAVNFRQRERVVHPADLGEHRHRRADVPGRTEHRGAGARVRACGAVRGLASLLVRPPNRPPARAPPRPHTRVCGAATPR